MIREVIDASLEGLDIGISGAVPLRSEWSEPAQDRSILEFVSLLSGLIFKYGGRVVHGAHPTFTPVILRQAALHARNRKRPPVTILMSDLWAKKMDRADRERIECNAEFIVVPQIGKDTDEDIAVRNASLTAMRQRLVSSMNVLVAVGGMRHVGTGLVPGVAEELNLAQRRGMACFVVGGFGGMAGEMAQKLGLDRLHLRNGLSDAQNEFLLSSGDAAACVSRIFEHISKQRAEILRPLANIEDEHGATAGSS